MPSFLATAFGGLGSAIGKNALAALAATIVLLIILCVGIGGAETEDNPQLLLVEKGSKLYDDREYVHKVEGDWDFWEDPDATYGLFGIFLGIAPDDDKDQTDYSYKKRDITTTAAVLEMIEYGAANIGSRAQLGVKKFDYDFSPVDLWWRLGLDFGFPDYPPMHVSFMNCFQEQSDLFEAQYVVALRMIMFGMYAPYVFYMDNLDGRAVGILTPFIAAGETAPIPGLDVAIHPGNACLYAKMPGMGIDAWYVNNALGGLPMFMIGLPGMGVIAATPEHAMCKKYLTDTIPTAGNWAVPLDRAYTFYKYFYLDHVLSSNNACADDASFMYGMCPFMAFAGMCDGLTYFVCDTSCRTHATNPIPACGNEVYSADYAALPTCGAFAIDVWDAAAMGGLTAASLDATSATAMLPDCPAREAFLAGMIADYSGFGAVYLGARLDISTWSMQSNIATEADIKSFAGGATPGSPNGHACPYTWLAVDATAHQAIYNFDVRYEDDGETVSGVSGTQWAGLQHGPMRMNYQLLTYGMGPDADGVAQNYSAAPLSNKDVYAVQQEEAKKWEVMFSPKNSQTNFVIAGANFQGFSMKGVDTITRGWMEISEEAMGSVAVGYVLLMIYAMLSMWSEKCLYSRVGVAFSGVALVSAAVVGTLGLSAYLGIKNNLYSVNVLPFILLGIGVDDMFVLAHNVEFSNADTPLPDLIADAMSKIGPSIFLTTTTNFLTFLCGQFSSLPLVQVFTAQAAIGLLLIFVAVVFGFTAVISLDVARIRAKRLDVLCFMKTESSAEVEHGSHNCIAKCLVSAYCKVLSSTGGKVGLLVFYLAFAIWALTGLGSLEVGDNYGGVFPKNSGPEVYINSIFRWGPEAVRVYTKEVDYPGLQLEWIQLVQEIAKLPNQGSYAGATVDSKIMELINYGATQALTATPTNCTIYSDPADAAWPASLDGAKFTAIQAAYLDETDAPRVAGVLDPASFELCSTEYIASGTNANFGTQTYINAATGKPKMILWEFFVTDMLEAKTSAKFMDTMDDIMDKYGGKLDAHYDSAQMSQLLAYNNLEEDVTQQLSVAAAMSFFVILGILALEHPSPSAGVKLAAAAQAAVLLLAAMTLIVFTSAGLMATFGLKWNAMTGIMVVCTFGIADEYCAHTVFAYFAASGSSSEKACEAMKRMLMPIIDGTISTFLSVVMLSQSDYPYLIDNSFTPFATVVLGCVMSGLTFVPAMLGLLPACGGAAGAPDKITPQ